VAASKFRNSRGEPEGLSHNLLIVPPDLERMAAQIVQNREVYDTGNREMNPYAGNMQLIVSPGAWLDSTAWFLLDGSQSTKPLGLLVRKEPTLVTWDVEEDSAGGTRYLKWHARLKIFYGNWRYAAMGNT